MLRRVRGFFSGMIWWFRYRTTLRFNVVNIRTLKPGYYDKDLIMLHACFQILVNFMEHEKPFEWRGYDPKDFIAFETKSLYEWWTKERPSRVELDSTASSLDLMRQEDAWEEEDQKNLLRLVHIRNTLWT